MNTRDVWSKEERGYRFEGVVTAETIINLAAQILEERLRREATLGSPQDTTRFLRHRLGGLPYEAFFCLFLDNRHRVIAVEELFRGTIDGAAVPPREVVRAILRHNAAALIVAHNHPSGVAEPSVADRALTKRLKDACDVIDVRILDHLIVAGLETTSLAERGLL